MRPPQPGFRFATSETIATVIPEMAALTIRYSIAAP
jgi:hypothetical protein